MKKTIISPIRWSGSKRKILPLILPFVDSSKEIYVEPFLGSGTMLLNMLSNKKFHEFHVNDINYDLVNFFEILKNESPQLITQLTHLCDYYNSLQTMIDKKEYYYDIRTQYNHGNLNHLLRAKFFWFLTKTCFNGVYRVNRKGEYNVPFGQKEHIRIDIQNLKFISQNLDRVKFYNNDYADFLMNINFDGILNKSFLYLDPPYLPETEISKNQKMYTSEHFSHLKHISLLNDIENSLETTMMLSMSDSDSSRKVYKDLQLTKTKVTDIVRVVNPRKLMSSSEIIFTNYDSPSLKFPVNKST